MSVEGGDAVQSLMVSPEDLAERVIHVRSTTVLLWRCCILAVILWKLRVTRAYCVVGVACFQGLKEDLHLCKSMAPNRKELVRSVVPRPRSHPVVLAPQRRVLRFPLPIPCAIC
jgi:hypothetical protein